MARGPQVREDNAEDRNQHKNIRAYVHASNHINP